MWWDWDDDQSAENDPLILFDLGKLSKAKETQRIAWRMLGQKMAYKSVEAILVGLDNSIN